MLTIKPYGHSHTCFLEAGRARRDIRLNEDPETPRDIAAFATDHADFVRAQWISSLDKIATKPVGNRKPTSEQRRFRDRLGRAALAFIVERKLVPDLGAGREAFERVWWAKIHPYGEETSDERKVSPKGRWFERFAGAVGLGGHPRGGNAEPRRRARAAEGDDRAALVRLLEHVRATPYYEDILDRPPCRIWI